MKLIYSLIFFLSISIGFSQSLPLDFESTTLPYPFTDFDGGVATKIANPQMGGINPSATVMQMVKGPGAVWAGSKITMANPIDFSTQRLFKVKVWSPVAGRKLLLKFEGAGQSFEKLSAPISAANVWEELSFDFANDVVNNVNNQIVFMFDFGTQGDGSANSTYLFDDVSQSTSSTPIIILPVLPLDFESTTVSYPFLNFAGGEASVVPNPDPSGINTSATVVKLVKNPGEVYGGSVLQMAGPIDFSSTTKVVKVKVWSPVAGKKLLLKFEGSPVDFDNGAFETEATITTANVWEELLFDYNSPTLFPPVNNNDNKIVFFFDFGTQGDGSVNSTYYFDDITFADALSAPTFNRSNVKLYPNPTTNQLTIESTSELHQITIYNAVGQEVMQLQPNSTRITIQTNDLAAGLYVAKTVLLDGTVDVVKFVKI
ncbi:MAG: hypothetical protein CFE24_10270 [Flavobacterium sp. BFFFF2]|nr:MAG: hypothetical protein CFE24_10270 [Flavobacterium sp. BFFFF2]